MTLAKVEAGRAAAGFERLLGLQGRLWGCLAAWVIRRRPAVGGFAYDRQLRPILTGAAWLLALEGTVLELVLALTLGSGVWELAVPAVHLYALAFLLGVRAAMVIRPHLIAGGLLLVRDGAFHELRVPLGAIRGCRPRRRANLGRSGWRLGPGEGEALLAQGDATVEIELSPADGLALDDRPWSGPLSRLWVTADDPAGFCAALRTAAENAGLSDP